MKPTNCFSLSLITVFTWLLCILFSTTTVHAAGVMNPTTPGVQASNTLAKSNARKAEKKRLRQAWKQAKAIMAATGRQFYRGDMTEKKRYNLSLLACIFGGGSLLMLFLFPPLGFLMAIAGLVTGIIGLGQYRDSPSSKKDGKTLAILGVVLGGATIAFTIIAVFVAIAIWAS